MQRRGQLSGVQVMFAAILAIGLILGINFSTRLAGSREQRDVFQNIEREIENLKQVQATLIAEVEFAGSEAYVEQWARADGKMVRPGEVLVVPLPAGARVLPPTPVAVAVEVETSPPRPEPWTLWWALFFDAPPPEF